jgi:hypothetical protein
LIFVHVEVERDRRVYSARVERGRPYLRECAPRGQVLEILCDVDPVRAAVLRVPELAVVRAGPDQSALNLRVLDVPHDLAVVLSKVVADDPAVRDHAGRVLRRQIRTQLGPRLSAVGRFENELTAIQHSGVIERIDRHRRRPVAAVLGLVRR